MLLSSTHRVVCRNAPSLLVKPRPSFLSHRPHPPSQRPLPRQLFASATFTPSVGSSADDQSQALSNGTPSTPQAPPTPPSFPNPMTWLLPLLLSGACAAAAALSHLGRLVIPAPIPYLLGGAIALTLIAAAAALRAMGSLQQQLTTMAELGRNQAIIEQQLTQEQSRAAMTANQLQEAAQQLADQKKQTDAAVQKLIEAESDLEAARAAAAHVDELQSVLEGKNKVLVALEQQLAGARKQAEEAARKQQETERGAQEAREKLGKVPAEILNDLPRALAALAALESQAAGGVDVLALQEATAKVERLEAELSEAMSARQGLESQLLDALTLVDKVPTLEREVEAAVSISMQLEADLKAVEAARGELEGRLEGAEREAAKVSKLEGEVKAAESKLKALQQELTKAQSQGSGSARESALAAEVAALKSKMESEVRQRAMDKKEMNLLKSITDDTTAELKEVKRDTVAREREILSLRKAITALDPTRLFEKHCSPGSPVSHLQRYIKQVVSGTSIRQAAVLGPDSGVWASTDGFPAASQQEAKALMKAFESGTELGALFGIKNSNMMVTFAGGKYELKKPLGRKDVLVGKGKNSAGKEGGMVLRKGKEVMVAATFDDANVEAVCEQRVVELGEYVDSLTTEAYVGKR